MLSIATETMILTSNKCYHINQCYSLLQSPYINQCCLLLQILWRDPDLICNKTMKQLEAAVWVINSNKERIPLSYTHASSFTFVASFSARSYRLVSSSPNACMPRTYLRKIVCLCITRFFTTKSKGSWANHLFIRTPIYITDLSTCAPDLLLTYLSDLPTCSPDLLILHCSPTCLTYQPVHPTYSFTFLYSHINITDLPICSPDLLIHLSYSPIYLTYLPAHLTYPSVHQTYSSTFSAHLSVWPTHMFTWPTHPPSLLIYLPDLPMCSPALLIHFPTHLYIWPTHLLAQPTHLFTWPIHPPSLLTYLSDLHICSPDSLIHLPYSPITDLPTYSPDLLIHLLCSPICLTYPLVHLTYSFTFPTHL